jgi:hypothetical protein
MKFSLHGKSNPISFLLTPICFSPLSYLLSAFLLFRPSGFRLPWNQLRLILERNSLSLLTAIAR